MGIENIDREYAQRLIDTSAKMRGWKCTRVIGKGSFGTVCEIRKGGESCALKIISIPVSDNELYEKQLEMGDNPAMLRAEFQRQIDKVIEKEISVLDLCRGQQNIVQLYDWEVITNPDNNVCFYVLVRMELLTDLMSYLKGKKHKDVLRMFYDVTQALVFLESRRMLHRDIKRANIMVSSKGTYKLTDFGEARDILRRNAASTMAGTPFFMAPEVAHHQLYDNRADLYSLAMTVYYCLNRNRYPFQNDNVSAQEAYNMRVDEARQIPPIEGVDDAFNAVLLKCLEYDPNNRYASAFMLLEEIKRVMESRSFRDGTLTITYVKEVPTGGSVGRGGTVRPAKSSSKKGLFIGLGAGLGAVLIAVILILVLTGKKAGQGTETASFTASPPVTTARAQDDTYLIDRNGRVSVSMNTNIAVSGYRVTVGNKAPITVNDRSFEIRYDDLKDDPSSPAERVLIEAVPASGDVTPPEPVELYFARRPDSVKNLHIKIDGRDAGASTLEINSFAGAKIEWSAEGGVRGYSVLITRGQTAEIWKREETPQSNYTIPKGDLNLNETYYVSVKPLAQTYGSVDASAREKRAGFMPTADTFEFAESGVREERGVCLLDASGAYVTWPASEMIERVEYTIDNGRKMTLPAGADRLPFNTDGMGFDDVRLLNVSVVFKDNVLNTETKTYKYALRPAPIRSFGVDVPSATSAGQDAWNIMGDEIKLRVTVDGDYKEARFTMEGRSLGTTNSAQGGVFTVPYGEWNVGDKKEIIVEIVKYAQGESSVSLMKTVSVTRYADALDIVTINEEHCEHEGSVWLLPADVALKGRCVVAGSDKKYNIDDSVINWQIENDEISLNTVGWKLGEEHTLVLIIDGVRYNYSLFLKPEEITGAYLRVNGDRYDSSCSITVGKNGNIDFQWGAAGSVKEYRTELKINGITRTQNTGTTQETVYTIPADALSQGEELVFSVEAVPYAHGKAENNLLTVSVKRQVIQVKTVTVKVDGAEAEEGKNALTDKNTDVLIEWSADGDVIGYSTELIVDGNKKAEYSEVSTQKTSYTIPAEMLGLGQTMTFRVTADVYEAASGASLEREITVKRKTQAVNDIEAELEHVGKASNVYLVQGDSVKLTWDYTGDAESVLINGNKCDPEAREYSINISDMKIGDPSRTVDFEFCDYDDTVYRMQFAYAVKPEDIDVKEFYIEGHENEGGVVPVEQDRDVVIRFGFSGDVKGYDYRLLKGGSVVAGNELSLEYATIPIPVAELEKETEYTFELRALPYRYGEVLCENPQTIRFRVDTSEIGTFELSIPDAEELRGDVYLLSRGKTYTLQWSADGTIKDAVCTVGNSRNPLSGDDLGHGGMPIGTNRISLGEVYEASVTLTSYKEGDTRTKKIKYALLPSPVESFTVNGIDAEDGVWRVEKDKYYEISFDAAGDVKEYTVRLGNETQTVAPDETYRFSTSSMTLEERRVLTVEAVPYTYGEVNADSQSWTLSLIPDEVTDFEISALQDAVKHPLEKDGDVWVIESGKNYTLTWKYEGDARGVRAYVEGVSGDLFALGASNGAAAKSRMITADSLRLEPGKEKTLTLALTPYEGETLYREAKFALRPESVKNLGITVDGKNAANGETVTLPKNASVNIGWHADNAKSLDYTTDLPQNAQSIEADGSLTVDTGRLTPGKVYSLTVQPESYAYGAIDEAASSWTVKLTLKPDEIASFEVSMPQSAEKSDGTWYLNADDATMRISATGDVESYTLNIEGRRQQTLAADAGEFDPEIASLAPGEKLRLTVTVNPMEYGDFKRGVSRTQSFTVARRPNAIADFTLTPHGVEEQPDGVYTVDSNLYFIYSYNGEAQSIELLVDDVPVDDDADGRLTINTSSWVLGQNYTVRAVAHAYEMGGDDADSQNFTLTLKPAAITKFDLTVNNKTISGDMYDVSKGKNVVLRASKTGDIRDYTISYDAATRQRPVTWYGTAFTLNSADWQLGREYTVTVTANPYPYADVETELTKTYKFRVTPATVTKFDVKQNLTRNEGNITVDVSGDIELLTVTLDGSTVYSAKPASFPVSVSIPDYDRWDFETEHKVKAVIELYENGKINRGVQSSVTLTLVRPADKVKISSVNVSGATSKNGVYLIDKNASSPALVWSISGDKKRVEVNSQRQTGSSYVLSTRGMAPGEERSVTLTVQGYGTSKDSKTVTYALKPDKLTSFSLAVDNRNATNGVWNVYRNEAVAVKWDYTGDVESVVVKLDGKTQKDVTGKQLSLNTSNWSFNEKHTVTVELKLFEHGENSVQTTKNITVQLVPREVTGAKLYVNGVEKTGNAMTVPKDKDVTLTWSVTGDPKSIKLTVDGKTEDVTDKPNFSISKTKFSDVKSTVRVTLTTTSYTGKVLTATVNLSREKIGITKISSLTLGGYAEKDNDVYVFDRNADIVFKWTCDGDVKKAVIGDGVTTETVSEGGISSARHTLAGLTDRQLGNIYIYTLSLTDYSGNVKSADVKLAFKPRTVTGFSFKLDTKTYANGAEIHVPKGASKILSWSVSGEAYHYKVKIDGTQVQNSASTEYTLPIKNWTAKSSHEVEIEIVPYIYGDVKGVSSTQKLRVIVDPDAISGFKVKLNNADVPSTIELSKSDKRNLSFSVTKGDVSKVTVTLKQGSSTTDSKASLGIGDSYTLEGSKLSYGKQYTLTVTAKGLGGDEKSVSCAVVLKPEPLSNLKIKIGNSSYADGQETQITKPDKPTLDYSVSGTGASEAYRFEFKLSGSNKTYKPGDKLDTSSIDMNRYQLTLTATPVIRTSGDKVYTCTVNLVIADRFEVSYDTRQKIEASGSQLSIKGLSITKGGTKLSDDEQKNVSVVLWDVTAKKEYKKFAAKDIKWSRSIDIRLDDPKSSHSFRFDVYYNGIKVGSTGEFKIETKKPAPSYTFDRKQSWNLNSAPSNAWVIIKVDAKYSADQIETIELFISSKEKAFTSVNVKSVEVKDKDSGKYEKALLWNVKSEWSDIQKKFGKTTASISLSCKTKDGKNYGVYTLIVGVTEQELRDAGVIK